MAGFDAEKLRASLRIPPDLQPMTVTAIGWPAHEPLPPLERLPLERIASRGRWPSGEER
jgi:hypothetical protein